MNEMKRTPSLEFENLVTDDNLIVSKNLHDKLLKNAVDALEKLKSAEHELLMIRKRKTLNKKKSLVSIEGQNRNEKQTLPMITKRISLENVS